MPRLLLVLLCALSAPARADPLDDHSGTEDWTQPSRLRRPVERYDRARRELDDEAEEFEKDQRSFDHEVVEFGRDRAALLRDLRARQAAAKKKKEQGERTAALVGDPSVDEEIKRLEERTAHALSKEKTPPKQTPAPKAGDDEAAPATDDGEDRAGHQASDEAAPAQEREGERKQGAEPVPDKR